MQSPQPMIQQEMFRRRLPLVIVMLVVMTLLLLGRLVSFQFQLAPEVVTYLESLANSGYSQTLRLAAARGRIYDRDGMALAVNTLEYRVGISPNLVSDPRETATQLAALLNQSELELFEQVNSNVPWVLLAPRVSAEVGQQIAQLDLPGVRIEPVARRSYPQGTLAAHLVGFVGGDLQGYYGIEGFYQDRLAGRERDQLVSNIPFDLPQSQEPNRGSDVILTIDRDMQFLAESELLRAISETGSTRGTILMMNPRNGDILAMASYPAFDPNTYFEVSDPRVQSNPAISEQYEPGSIMKLITMGVALDLGIVAPSSTYVDQGLLEIGGITIQNWDRQAHGVVDMTQVLVQSLNVGAATVSMQLGPTAFYQGFRRFGFGRATGIDLEGEAEGIMYVPGDTDWSESNLGTNSYGQGIAVTPLQMLTAVAAIANDGLMMQPHVMHQIVDGDQVYTAEPSTLGRVMSAETADILTEMMVAVVRDGLDGQAVLPGYTIAGKTGTAEIPTPLGYEPGVSIVSFVGFLPADDPQVAVLVKLDRPTGYWGSRVAAPVFRELTERLVILMKIPPDDIRYALGEAGGDVSEIDR